MDNSSSSSSTMDKRIRPRPRSSTLLGNYIVRPIFLNGEISDIIMDCISKTTDKKFTLKILDDNFYSKREIELHFQSSICKHIVNVVDFFRSREEKKLFLIMEWMAGGTLLNQVVNYENYNETRAAKILFDICKAIKFLHSINIAHRDLKLENIMFTDNGVLKVIDLGFAKICKPYEKSLNTPVYTKYYAAPEILTSMPYDKACDLWSLGVILFILLSGTMPFESRETQDADVSPYMKEKIMNSSYSFSGSEWDDVSQDAKNVIRGLLEVDPLTRMTIDEVVNSNWMKKRKILEDKQLKAKNILKENEHEWTSMSQEMSVRLAQMRKIKPRMQNKDENVKKKTKNIFRNLFD